MFQPVSGSGPIEELSWWHWVPGAYWRHPEGPGSDLAGRGQHPVVQVAYEDAEAFARWAGGLLPSEAQWEFAARGGLKNQIFAWGNTWNPHRANTWQGTFPRSNPWATSPSLMAAIRWSAAKRQRAIRVILAWPSM